VVDVVTIQDELRDPRRHDKLVSERERVLDAAADRIDALEAALRKITRTATPLEDLDAYEMKRIAREALGEAS
jgi:hypothetical protein